MVFYIPSTVDGKIVDIVKKPENSGSGTCLDSLRNIKIQFQKLQKSNKLDQIDQGEIEKTDRAADHIVLRAQNKFCRCGKIWDVFCRMILFCFGTTTSLGEIEAEGNAIKDLCRQEIARRQQAVSKISIEQARTRAIPLQGLRDGRIIFRAHARARARARISNG